MPSIRDMLSANKKWADEINDRDPGFFARVSAKQTPEVLWIGCSDSRVGPDQLVSMPIGSIFVHRNIGNLFATNDLNCLAVLEFAIDELKVPNVVVTGHYGCGGVYAALKHSGIQPVDLWLDQIRFIYHRHAAELEELNEEQRWNRLAELNVEAQVHNICRNTIVREAWKRGQEVNVIGLIYDIHDGRLLQMGLEFSSLEAWEACYGVKRL
ncbi:MAG: carbonic anhydrase [Zetaproteobacteria bacterium CG06_land_8_20_14_3_00_59_53]|nr:MAG: carbonic anhydrase [Zetaproteobacteria bacterium CG2_30_59_37]PIO89987.1 MAG: carbonic anhydrase [Zetaproteobacteria bacterium CG23_combo_of_CG06-09_8_20_14_all_59_86]PIQ64094.1 MAG: carbonic anhydrase [Zetaproteobacteria bacterium CG11_big_fil_rev_8_21_14_0_20_59_439]PIU69918.1 MAG: carbonic anhydrase [Zetaproteobacteria bacterium CG06_land_8_20_14_3_00_59_53]PIU97592.1 MAG: carbonic anhydrase [Zetaproteobacteria bacterium CG03_land_8_20_14_0_80_59_51]PIY47093.1 MAG: carbonic anhydras